MSRFSKNRLFVREVYFFFAEKSRGFPLKSPIELYTHHLYRIIFLLTKIRFAFDFCVFFTEFHRRTVQVAQIGIRKIVTLILFVNNLYIYISGIYAIIKI